MRVVRQKEIKNLDQIAIDNIGMPSLVLMENAGLQAAKVIHERCQTLQYNGEIVIICGRGKNGGDGLVVARHLQSYGHKIRVFLMDGPIQYRDECGVQLNILKNMKLKITVIESVNVLREYFDKLNPPFFVVDAILGTGIDHTVEGLYFDVIETINENANYVFSLDIPSGVHADTGEVMGTAVQANETISFGFPKLGHFLYPGAVKRGILYNIDLTYPVVWRNQGDLELLTLENTASLLKLRDPYGHKNSFGHCLLVGGSQGKLGAIALASQACLKMGTGLVTVASWEDSFPILEAKLPSEIMSIRLTKTEDGSAIKVPEPGYSLFSACVIGPGLGLRKDGAIVLRQALSEFPGPMVIDADGLNIVGDYKLYSLIQNRQKPTVLTPHPGEMARLLGVSKQEVVKDPINALKQAVELTGAVVVLKGATTLLSSVDGKIYLNHYPNDGMATAGSGDVLAGMIGGILGQGLSGLEAAKLGVYLHSLAGKYAALAFGPRAMTSGDIIHSIKDAFKELREYQPKNLKSACERII
jgi:NAD(P)H-hydrate epimerase